MKDVLEIIYRNDILKCSILFLVLHKRFKNDFKVRVKKMFDYGI